MHYINLRLLTYLLTLSVASSTCQQLSQQCFAPDFSQSLFKIVHVIECESHIHTAAWRPNPTVDRVRIGPQVSSDEMRSRVAAAEWLMWAAHNMNVGPSFNCSFLRRSFLNLTVKNHENWSTFAEVIAKIKVSHFILRQCKISRVWPSKSQQQWHYFLYMQCVPDSEFLFIEMGTLKFYDWLIVYSVINDSHWQRLKKTLINLLLPAQDNNPLACAP